VAAAVQHGVGDQFVHGQDEVLSGIAGQPGRGRPGGDRMA
jgi:hypothetical protein